MTPTPRVSVLIPVYNAQHTIDSALASVFAQTWADFELIVVDDGSTDDTLERCEAYETDSRLRLIRHEQNLGRPASRNTAFDAARGEYIAMLDADDCCVPERLARQVTFLDDHSTIDVVGSWWRGMDVDGTLAPLKRNQTVLAPDMVDCQLLFRGIIHNPTVMARRSALAGFAYDTTFPVAQDYDLWARMQQAGHRFAQIPEVLLHYRHHATQASTARAEEARERRCDIQGRLLTSLGVEFDAEDVVIHNLLYTGRRLYEARMGRSMDRAFVLWAKQWFQRLLNANQVSGFYPEPAFSDLVSELWFSCCQKAARTAGHLFTWRQFIASAIGRRYLRRRVGLSSDNQ